MQYKLQKGMWKAQAFWNIKHEFREHATLAVNPPQDTILYPIVTLSSSQTSASCDSPSPNDKILDSRLNAFSKTKGKIYYRIGSFRGEDFLDIDQSETRIACDGHVC
jgi:hypothetical protein